MQAQSPADQYLTLRRQSRLNPKLRAADVKLNPASYAGQTLEFRGIYRGSISDDEGVLLLLEVQGEDIPPLRMSVRPEWLGQNSQVRVLCVASSLAEGEMRAGWPDLTLVAIADASELDVLEEQARRREAARIAAAAPRRNPSPVASASGGSGFDMGPPPPRFRGPRRAVETPSPPSGSPSAEAVRDLSESARAVFAAYQSYIRRHNRRLSERQADDITYAILKFSEQWDMDPRLIVATIIAESDFRIHERSHAGAMGLIQLMPDEVRRLRLTNPYDPIQNVMGGIFLLKERLNKYSGSSNFKDANLEHIILTLASYNAGEGAVRKYKGVPPYRETRGYVRRIEKLYRELCAADGAGQ